MDTTDLFQKLKSTQWIDEKVQLYYGVKNLSG